MHNLTPNGYVVGRKLPELAPMYFTLQQFLQTIPNATYRPSFRLHDRDVIPDRTAR